MYFNPLFSDGDCIRHQLMKSLSRVALSSIAGALLGVASFFAVDGPMPSTAEAHDIDGSDATVWLMNTKLKDAVGTPFLYSCEIDDGDADPVEVTCWGAPTSL